MKTMPKTKKTKTAAMLLLCVLAVSLLPCGSAYAANDISIYIDGERLSTDVPPMIIEGRTLIPLRVVSEAVGCEVGWSAVDQRIVVYTPAGSEPILVMTVGDPRVTVNWYDEDTGDYGGNVVIIDVPPMIVNGRTLVPLRFIAETIGFEVSWNDYTQSVYLESGLYGNG